VTPHRTPLLRTVGANRAAGPGRIPLSFRRLHGVRAKPTTDQLLRRTILWRAACRDVCGNVFATFAHCGMLLAEAIG
jgi:hypothetical protein